MPAARALVRGPLTYAVEDAPVIAPEAVLPIVNVLLLVVVRIPLVKANVPLTVTEEDKLTPELLLIVKLFTVAGIARVTEAAPASVNS